MAVWRQTWCLRNSWESCNRQQEVDWLTAQYPEPNGTLKAQHHSYTLLQTRLIHFNKASHLIVPLPMRLCGPIKFKLPLNMCIHIYKYKYIWSFVCNSWMIFHLVKNVPSFLSVFHIENYFLCFLINEYIFQCPFLWLYIEWNFLIFYVLFCNSHMVSILVIQLYRCSLKLKLLC